MMHDYIKTAQESRVRELDAAIQRFRECGVEIERFWIQEHPAESVLYIDGIPRFSWRMVHAETNFIECPTCMRRWRSEVHCDIPTCTLLV